MKTTRRNFVKLAGLGSVGLSVLSSFEFQGTLAQNLPRATPESQGVDTNGILNFLQAIQVSGLEWHSFMLVRHGHVVAEGWWKPFAPEFKHTLYSLSKSFTSTAIGFLVSEGKITVNDPVLKFFPKDAPADPGENLKAMRVKHLLTMNTGHDADTLPAIRNAEGKSWVETFLAQPVLHAPGSHFLYNTGATYMLGAIVYSVTGQTLEEYLEPRLFKPLGIVGYDWEKSPQGLNTAGYGLRVKTEDIARFGQFYLQKGMWEGKQLLPAAWIEEATSKQTESQKGDGDWSQGYGYQFWRCKPGFYRGDGAYGQFCFVMPEQDAVLVMTSESWDLQKSMNIAYENLLPAFAKGQLPEKPTELAILKKELSQLTLPVPQGSKTSPLAARYNDKVFTINKNSFNITELSVGLNKDSCVLKMATPGGMEKITFGWEDWKLNPGENKMRFPVATRLEIPSRIAGTATWLDDNTLQLKQKFVDAIHGDTLTLTFQGDTLAVDFMNSVSAHVKTFPDQRQKLTGTMKG
ncbi:serine hydrolase domain-containing protein [Salmonirosea aquatica]|uniref:Serine hydrolase n=1 Tax=Salmonirosea aquatica TaxID=2654236 RepID=A0A7C9BF60_9BACT|nr:serine hydrolase [Cytophagaceae bacterium SJW1-29]